MTFALGDPRLGQLKYLSSLFFPGCVLAFLIGAPHTSIIAFAWTLPLWFLLLLDWLSPKRSVSDKPKTLAKGFYNSLLILLSILQFAIIALLVYKASLLQWDTLNNSLTSICNLIAMRILVGTSSGSSAIIVAHELLHRQHWGWRLLARLLMFSVCYDHFIISHQRSHHFQVATPEDIVTARMGESFKAYWKRVLPAHFNDAWRSELSRLHISKQPFAIRQWRNKVLQGVVIEFLLALTILLIFGWIALIIFCYQALSGIRLLETINYYQHWGLQQGRQHNTLAWVNQSAVSQYALIGLPNHIAHHSHAEAPFYNTPYSLQGPIMPYGYFVSNLWVKMFNRSYCTACEEIIQSYHQRT